MHNLLRSVLVVWVWLRAACRAWVLLCCDWVVPGALCWCAVVLAGWCLASVIVVCAACWQALLGSGWWCFGRHHARLVLLVRRRLRLLSVVMLGWLWSAIWLLLRLRCLPSRGWGCVGAWPPLMAGPIVLVPGPPHGGTCCVGAWPPPMVGRDVSVCAPPHGGARRAGAWPASWPGVRCCCWGPLMVGRAVWVRRPPHGGACSVGACPPRWLCVVWWCWACVVVCAAWRPASSGSGWWCLKRAPCAACFVGSASSSPPYGRRVRVAVVGGQVAVGVVLFAWPGLVLCWCVAPLLVGFAALVRGPPHGRACCVGARPPPTVGRAVSLCGPSHGGACCAGVWPASCSAVLHCCVAPLKVGRSVRVCGPPHGGACFFAACLPRGLRVVWWCLAWAVVVCAAWQPASLGSGWWCSWWCFSRRHALLVLFVRCCLHRLTVGVLGCLWSALGLRLWLC